MSKSCSIKVVRLAAVAVAVWALGASVWATPCSYKGSPAFCQWSTGCYSIDDAYGEPKGLTCDEYVASCEKNGSVYHGVTGLDASNDYGSGLQCSNQGGTWAGGKDPNEAGKRGFCDWGPCVWDPADEYSCLSGGCFEINTDKELSDCGSNVVATKADCPLISLPKADGGTNEGDDGSNLIYCRYEGDSTNCHRKTAADCEETYGEVVTDCNAASDGVYCDYGAPSEYGEGGCYWTPAGASECTANSGTVVSSCDGSSVKVNSLQVSKIAGLRATYARGSIGVTYNAATSIVSGKVQLVNTKGRVVASAPISKSAGSTTVSAQLSFKKVPAGMYFVRVNAKDVKGKRVAEQTSISIVK